MWKTTTTVFENSWRGAKKSSDDRIQHAIEENLASLLSAEQCKEILNKLNENENPEKHLQFLRHTITPATEVKGFLGEYYRLFIEVNKENVDHCQEIRRDIEHFEKVNKGLHVKEVNSGSDVKNVNMGEDENAYVNVSTLKFFIKKLPMVPEEDEKNKIFKKESLLYNTAFKELEKYAPQSWFPKLFLSTTNLLVLQDLGDLGYQSLACKDNLKESEMYAVLKGLASMHATSLLFERETQRSIADFWPECLEEITVHPDISWFTTGVNAMMQIAVKHPNYQLKVSQDFIKNQLPLHINSVFSMVNTSPIYHNVLCHRDTWGGNIFLKNQDQKTSPAVFVDFQTCRYCPPAIDVIFTLFMNLSKDIRLERELDYLDFYWNQLKTFVLVGSSEISDVEWEISKSEFMESYMEFQLFGYVYRALAAMILKVPPDFVTEEYKNVERSEKLFEYMKVNSEFRFFLEECIKDVIETAKSISMKNLN